MQSMICARIATLRLRLQGEFQLFAGTHRLPNQDANWEIDNGSINSSSSSSYSLVIPRTINPNHSAVDVEDFPTLKTSLAPRAAATRTCG